MKNYIETIITVSQFQQENLALSEQAKRAKDNLYGFYPNSDEDDFIIITVEGYHCVACLIDLFAPYEVAEIIAPFDKDTIYPIQGLVTQFAFKRY